MTKLNKKPVPTLDMGRAVNTFDASALESLEAINHRFEDGGITLHCP